MKYFKTKSAIEKLYVHLLYHPTIYTAVYAYLYTHNAQRLIVLGLPLSVITILSTILERHIEKEKTK